MGWIDLFKKKNVDQNTALSENKITESRDMAVGNHTGIVESKSKHIVPGISSTQTDSAQGQFRTFAYCHTSSNQRKQIIADFSLQSLFAGHKM